MPDSVADPKPKKKRRGLWWKIPLTGLVVLLLAFAIFRFAVYQRVQTRLNAIRDAGYPITLEELDAWYAYPDGPNAADVYQKAFDAYVGDEEIEETLPIFNPDIKLPPPVEPLPDEMVQLIEDYLADNAEAIALLEDAALIDTCRFPIDLKGEYIRVLLPHLGQLRRGARTLRLQSMIDADRGNYDLATQRCITITALARSLKNEPIPLSSLVSMNIQVMAYDQIEILINRHNLDEDQLLSLSDAIETADFDKMLLRAMVGEWCGKYAYFHDSRFLVSMFFMNVLDNHLFLTLWRVLGFLDIDRSCSIGIMQDNIDYAQNTSWPLPASVDIDGRIPWTCRVTGLMASNYSTMCRAFVGIEARHRTIITGIAAERYRQKHGQLPEQLHDLVPEFLEAIPEDPFSGQALCYRLEDSGAIIYSVNSDGIDDGGYWLNKNTEPYKNGSDISFTFGGLQEKLWPRSEVEGEQSE